MYPALDLSIPAAQKWSPGQEKFLVRMGPVFNSAYCPDVRLRTDRLVSPASDADTAALVGIAPGLVISAEHDILREEARRYAQRLHAADALIGHLDLEGVGHAFNMGGAGRDVVRPVYEEIAEAVRVAFV
ncbi:alpha/beta hydrolase fold domain-containing protein [Nesterenkonia sandarakina]|uniref:Acetyl esterase n=1 Tax=Nesterenkonia sandarakina TaxID=272918 RepID=A0A2T0YAK4_9MICC|nr:alpha/beta hydrolase fold domain-containing protein [Nesterenkonia sandarakina]PRZ11695.1 acetyl esterase [Nesterenkonia sandarakina]